MTNIDKDNRQSVVIMLTVLFLSMALNLLLYFQLAKLYSECAELREIQSDWASHIEYLENLVEDGTEE